MASGSLKDLIKVLGHVLDASPSPYPLPSNVSETIQQYLDKHPNIADVDSQRLQDDLMSLYNKLVANDESKHAVFLASLRLLIPAIRGTDRLVDWWNVLLRPTIESLSSHKGVVEDAREMLLSVLVFDDDEDADGEKARASTLFTNKLLEIYLKRTTISSLDEDPTLVNDKSSAVVAEHIESVLVAFGRRRPLNLLAAIDALMVKKQHRAQALSLLCTFVRHQPPHLYEVLKTDLMEHLLQCLMIDTSTMVVSLALTGLIMFLPHIPSSLALYLPRLFAIYARIMCWEKADPDRVGDEGSAGSGEEATARSPISTSAMFSDSSWDTLRRSSEVGDSATPDLTHLFTFLYGLYPLNFMSFVRKPSKYLRDAKLPGADDLKLDTSAIHSRSEKYRRIHLLHPHFYTMTVETELADTNRFLESEPADVVAQCMGLCVAEPTVLNGPGPPPTGKLPSLPPSARVSTEDIPPQTLLEDGSEGSSPTTRSNSNSWRNTQSTAVSFSAAESMKMLQKSSQHSMSRRSSRAASRIHSPSDSPTLPPHIQQSSSDTKLKDMLQAQESLRTNLRNDSNASLSTQEAPRLDAYIQSLAHAPISGSPAMGPTTNGATPPSVGFLQREILLLKNDLNFERYLKQQHLSHIGQLQRKYIREATVEAETQKLINNNKTLKMKQEEAKKTLAALRKETTASKAHAKKWEAELNAKAKSLREDQRKWKADEDALRHELREAHVECDQLKKLVVETEAKELLSRQKLQSVEASLLELDQLRTEVESMTKRLREYEGREEQYEFGKQNEEIARTQLETLRLKFKARNGEMEKVKKAYDERLNEISDRLSQAQQSPAHSPQAFQAMLDTALASGHARFVQLKRLYNHLLSRYAELEMKYMELQAHVDQPERDSYDGSADTGPRRPLRDVHSTGKLGDEFDFFGGHRNDDDNVESRSRKASATESIQDGWGSSGYRGGPGSNPITPKFPPPPARLESLEDYEQMDGMSGGLGPVNSLTGTNGASIVGHGPVQGYSYHHNSRTQMTPFEHSLGPLRSRGRDSDGSSEHSTNTKPKIKASSQVRVYGRGGVQNIGKKDKKKDKGGAPKPLTPAAAALKNFRGFG